MQSFKFQDLHFFASHFWYWLGSKTHVRLAVLKNKKVSHYALRLRQLWMFQIWFTGVIKGSNQENSVNKFHHCATTINLLLTKRPQALWVGLLPRLKSGVIGVPNVQHKNKVSVRCFLLSQRCVIVLIKNFHSFLQNNHQKYMQ